MDEVRAGSRPWLNVGLINAQAQAEKIGKVLLGRFLLVCGIVMEVNVDKAKNRLKSFDLAAPGLRVCQRICRRQFGANLNERSLRIGSEVAANLVTLTRPGQFRVGLGYILPRNSPFRTGKQRQRGKL